MALLACLRGILKRGHFQNLRAMPCPTCHASDTLIESISRKRAARAAHALCLNECEKGTDARFEYVDIYVTLFRRIYEHEYTRNMYVERERRDYAIRMSSERKHLCDYHLEFDDAFCRSTMKSVEREYARSKWPNDLPG